MPQYGVPPREMKITLGRMPNQHPGSWHVSLWLLLGQLQYCSALPSHNYTLGMIWEGWKEEGIKTREDAVIWGQITASISLSVYTESNSIWVRFTKPEHAQILWSLKCVGFGPSCPYAMHAHATSS